MLRDMSWLFALVGLFVLCLVLLQIDRLYWEPRDVQRLLVTMLDGRERFGLDLASQAHVRRSSLYLRLHNMEERGLVISRIDDGALSYDPQRGLRPRRLYKITEDGIHHLRKSIQS